MLVIIPHKDTLFALSKIQKEIILSFNKKYSQNKSNVPAVFPSYPLWCFLDESFTSEKFQKLSSCKIEEPVFNKSEFYFPIVFSFDDDSKSIEQKIIFATFNKNICAKKNSECNVEINSTVEVNSTVEINSTIKVITPCKQDIQLNTKDFPFNARIFRLAEVELKNNGWQAFNERWIKL
ncbi:MAG: hypothetical protein WCQ67_01810 [Treponema sp.]